MLADPARDGAPTATLKTDENRAYSGRMIQRRFKVAELRIQVPDELVKSFQERLGSNVKLTAIAKDAMALFNGAVGERAQGRVVLSSDKELETSKQITMPSLDNVKQGR